MYDHKKELYLLKIAVIGASASGRQALISRYIEHCFHPQSSPMIGIDFKVFQHTNAQGQLVRTQCWNLKYAPRCLFNTISENYLKNMAVFLVTLDLTDPNGITNTLFSLSALKQLDTSPSIILVGTKADHEHQVISQEQAQQLATDFKIDYWATSAKNNNNIDQVFELAFAKGMAQPLIRSTFFGQNKVCDKPTVVASKAVSRKSGCSIC